MATFLRLASTGALVLALAAPATSQTTREHLLGGRALAPVGDATAARRITSTEGGADARAVVQRIISAIGIPMTNFEVRASPPGFRQR